MEQKLLDYMTLYQNDLEFMPTEQEHCEVCGADVTVTVCEYAHAHEHRVSAHILLEKNGYRYECEGVERTHWEFFPVTVGGRHYIFFSKTLYGFTLLDVETLTEVSDFFPEKVLHDKESFIITHAQTFGKYLILDGCYWGAPYEFAALDPAQMRFVSLTEAYGILAGDHTACVQGDKLFLKGENMDYEPAEITVSESDLDRLMDERGTTDF